MKRRLNPIIIKKIDQSDLDEPVKKAINSKMSHYQSYAPFIAQFNSHN